ncbi:MAG: Ig-like domain-containing protein [Candidatus Micrarchaeota archaeon]
MKGQQEVLIGIIAVIAIIALGFIIQLNSPTGKGGGGGCSVPVMPEITLINSGQNTGEITIEWTQATADYYNIEWRKDSGNWQQINNIEANSFTHLTSQPGEQHDYRIKSCCMNLTGDICSEWTEPETGFPKIGNTSAGTWYYNAKGNPIQLNGSVQYAVSPSYLWNIINGNPNPNCPATASGPSPTITCSTAGNATTTLKITNPDGQTQTSAPANILVSEPITMTAGPGTNPGEIIVNWNDVGETTYQIFIGFGTTDIDEMQLIAYVQAPPYIMPSDSTYETIDVKLGFRVYGNGIFSNGALTYPKIGQADAGGPYSAAPEENITLHAIPLYAGIPVSYNWTINGTAGCPATATGKNPVITCSNPGTANAILTVNAGNGSSQDTAVINISGTDSVPPTINITSPSNGATVTGITTITATATDNSGGSGLKEIKIFIDSTQKTNCLSSPCSFSWNTTFSSDGDHAIKATAQDNAGNLAEKVITVYVDNIPDSIVPAIPAGLGAQPGLDSGEIKVSWNLSTEATSYEMRWWYVGGVENPVTGNPPKTYTTDSSPLNGLSHCHKVRACNSIGCSGYSFQVCAYPQIGINLRTNYQTGTNQALQLEVPTIEFKVNPAYSWEFTGSNFGSCNITGTLTANPIINCSETGTLTGTLTITDTGRTQQETTTITVTTSPDNTPPAVSITNPNQGNLISETISLQANATDSESGIKKVEFYIDDSIKGTDTTSPYSIQWNSRKVANGTHTIKAKATDNAGNTAEDEIEINVSNSVLPGCGNGIIDSGEECEMDSECISAYPENYCDYDLKKYGSRSVECSSCICSVEGWNYSTTKYCNKCSPCGDGEINCSETEESCPEDVSAPERPTGLELIRTTENSAVIQWNPNTEENLKRYVIYYGTTSRNYTEKELVDKEKISFTLTGLKKATKYYIALTAENTKDIESAYSNEVIATTQQGMPVPAPEKLSAIQKSSNVYLEWNHTNPKPENYIIERKESNSWEEIKTTSSNSYNDKSVETGKTYYYRIKAYDEGRSSDYSNETKVTVKKPEERKDDSLQWIIGTAIIIIAGALAYAYYHFEG